MSLNTIAKDQWYQDTTSYHGERYHLIVDPKTHQAFRIRKPVENPALLQLLPRWMFNRSLEDLGVIRFGFDYFPRTFKRKFGVSKWVRPSMYSALAFKPGMTKIERANVICTPRSFSKTVWFGKTLPIYLIVIGQYGIYYYDQKDDKHYLLPEVDYIRLRAKTQEKAEEKFANITAEFRRDDFIELFGDLEPSVKEVRDKKMKNQAKLMTLRNGYIFQAQGINQPSRGANIYDMRPKVDINDDVENKENTKTVGSRTYNAKEILGEQFGGLDDDGLTIYIGNYVHEQCLIAKFMRSGKAWKKTYWQATFLDEQGIERSLWPERYPVSFMKKLENWYKEHPDEEAGGYKIFMMEYYNKIVSDMDYPILHWDGYHKVINGDNYIIVKEEGEKDRTLRCYVVVTCDPGISDQQNVGTGVVSVVAFASDLNRYVLNISQAKFDIQDRYYEPSLMIGKVLAQGQEEMENVRRPGLPEEAVRNMIIFNADAWVVERAGIQMAWFNNIVDILSRLGKKTEIPKYAYPPPKMPKKQKLEDGVMVYIGTGRYYLRKSMRHRRNAEIEIETFPDSGLHILDTFHFAEQMKHFPEQPREDAYGRFQKVDNSDHYVEELPEDVEPWILF